MVSTGLIGLLFLGSLLFLVMSGVPIAYAMGGASIFLMLFPLLNIPFSPELVAIQLYHGPNSFIFLAFPFYLLLGRLMNRFGLTERIFRFANAIIGQFRGGLAYVNIIASLIFAGMSGLSTADVAGLGRIEYRAMRDNNYPKNMSLGITASSAIVGPIMPPSVPVIFFAVIAQQSVGKMFIAGIVPAFLMSGSLMVFAYVMLTYVHTERLTTQDFEKNELIASSKAAVPSLLLPLLVIGGIVLGFFTATEAGVVAVFYAILLGWQYDKISLGMLGQEVRDSMVETFAITIIIAAASLYSFVAVQLKIPVILAESVLSISDSPIIILMLLTVVFIIIGTFMDKISAIALLVPILLPVTNELGIDPIHFGVVMIVSLMFGVLTPPVGGGLFGLEKVTDATMEEIISAVIPYYIPILVVILLIILFPSLVLTIPDLFL